MPQPDQIDQTIHYRMNQSNWSRLDSVMRWGGIFTAISVVPLLLMLTFVGSNPWQMAFGLLVVGTIVVFTVLLVRNHKPGEPPIVVSISPEGVTGYSPDRMALANRITGPIDRIHITIPLDQIDIRRSRCGAKKLPRLYVDIWSLEGERIRVVNNMENAEEFFRRIGV